MGSFWIDKGCKAGEAAQYDPGRQEGPSPVQTHVSQSCRAEALLKQGI